VAKSLEGPRRAVVEMKGGRDIDGRLVLEQASLNSPVKIRGVIYGLEPGQHGIHIHEGSSLGNECELVGSQFNPTESERPIGFLGNVKTFSGKPSRTDVNLIVSSVSLFEDNIRSVLGRSVVIHTLPNDYARSKKLAGEYTSDDLLACGLIRQSESEREEVFRNIDRESTEAKPYNRFSGIEKSILDGEKNWENVQHPFYGGAEIFGDNKPVASNLNVEGIDRPDLSPDSLSLKSAVSTPKVWRGGRSYEYEYKGFIATGMFGLSPKTSGGSIEGRLVVEPVDESTINVALLSIRAKMFNEDVIPELIESNPGSEARVVDREHLEKPIQVKIINGKIESVAISKDEPLWTVNFKRGLVSQLQLQLDGSSGVFGEASQAGYYADNAVYHTMEGCTSGECQTWYHISQVPKEALNAEPELLTVPELCAGSPVYEIVKNRDFDKCRVLPIYQYNSLEGLNCDIVNGAGCENKISHVDLVRIFGCRNSEGHFIVQRIKAMDKIVYKPFSYETEATEGKTEQHFHLRAVHPAGSLSLSSRLPTDVHLYQTLSYSFDEDYKTHGPLMGKPSLRSVNSPMVMEVEKETLKSEAGRLLSEIVTDLESESFYLDPMSKFVPAKINMLRRALASLDYSELVAFVGKVMETNQWSTVNQVTVDALVLSGTNPSLMIVRDMILKGRISGEQAVQVMSLFVGAIETPTKELLSSFIEMLNSDVVLSHRQLKITSALAISKLVYQACINSTTSLNMFPKLVMGEFCNAEDNIIVNVLLPWLTEQLNNATDAGERIAMLTALGNIGHEIILPAVLPYITSCEPSTAVEFEWIERNRRSFTKEGDYLSKKEMRQKWLKYKQELMTKSYERQEQSQSKFEKEYEKEEEEWRVESDLEDDAACNIVRSKAIFALANLAVEKKEIVSTILMPIYFNKAEETEVRLAALSLLFVANPPQAFYTRIALSTWLEPNDQVAHYVYTTIASQVANKDPKHRDVTVRAESVLPLMKPMLWTSHSAINYLKAGFQEKARVGYVTETIAFPGFESFIPSHHYNSLHLTLGPWFTKLVEYSVSGKQLEKFADRVFGKPGMRSKLNRFDDGSITSPELKRIHEELKIEARATGQPELYIYLNFLDNYQRFFTLNPTTIMKTIEKVVLQRGFATSAGGKANVNYHKYVPVLDSFSRVPSSMGLAYSIVGHHSIFVSIKAEINGNMNANDLSAEMEAIIKPVIQFKMSSRMMAETPFTRSYPFTGVQLQSAVALPNRWNVEADAKSAKIVSTFELLGDKLHLAKYSVIPFTSIRKIEDFTPALLLKETKYITLLDEPKENKIVYGRPLGLNLIYVQRGDLQSFNTPLLYSKDWFGTLVFYALPSTLRYREFHIFHDVAASESKVFKTTFSFAAKSADELKSDANEEKDLFTTSLFNTLFGDKINKPADFTKEQEDKWTATKLGRVFKSLAAPFGYSLDFSAELQGKDESVKSRRVGASIAYGIGDFGKSHRASIMMEKRQEFDDSENNNFVFCADLQVDMPETVSLKRDMIRDDAERSSTIKIAFGKSCVNDRQITISTKMGRFDKDIPSTVQSKWEEERCNKQELSGEGISKECLSTRRLASLLNKAEITVDYNEMPAIVRNATVKFNNLFRHLMAPYMSDNQVEVSNTDNQIRIESFYYPIIGSMDIRVFKPKSNTFYHSIDVHPVAEVLLPARMAVPRSILAAPAICLVDRENITTFDGLHYNATFGGCDHLITKDCSGRYKMAVLARHENDKKIVTILLDNEKIVINAAQMKIKVNDMELSLKDVYVVKNAENKIVAQIRRTADQFVEVDSPTHLIRVTCDAKEIMIAGSPIHRGRLCGLCGSQTGNKFTDLTGPRQCSLPRDLMDVAYELKRPAGCKSIKTSEDIEQLRQVQDECIEEKKSNVFGMSDSQALLPHFQQKIYSSVISRSPSKCMQYRNKMIVRENSNCFSTVAVPKCSEHCRAVNIVEKKMAFHCMPKNIMSQKLIEEMSDRSLDEISGKEISYVQTFSVPSACLPAQ